MDKPLFLGERFLLLLGDIGASGIGEIGVLDDLRSETNGVVEGSASWSLSELDARGGSSLVIVALVDAIKSLTSLVALPAGVFATGFFFVCCRAGRACGISSSAWTT